MFLLGIASRSKNGLREASRFKGARGKGAAAATQREFKKQDAAFGLGALKRRPYNEALQCVAHPGYNRGPRRRPGGDFAIGRCDCTGSFDA